MKYLLTKILCLMMAAMLFSLSGCDQAESDATAVSTLPTENTYSHVENLILVVTEDDIATLNNYPNLKTLDLSGSTCYEAIAAYIADHPQVAVTYTIDLGGTSVSNHDTELTLESGSFDYEVLTENLIYLPKLSKLALPGLTVQEVQKLQSTYPDIALAYSINLFGREITAEDTHLDLSDITPDQVPEAAEALQMLPQIVSVELMDSQGKSQLSVADVKTLVDAAPDAMIHYTFQLFGKTVSTTDETIDFVRVDIGNQGESELRQALDILCGCTKLTLDNCGFDNEVLAQVRNDYPNTKIVWRVYAGTRSFMTDTEVLRAVYHVDDSNSGNFRYCNEVKYLDLGHNTEMLDLSFISYMPELEIVILSGSVVTDLTAFANSTKLVFLELAYCSDLTDISPLAGCTSLQHLNLSFTSVSDFSALKELPLEQLCYVGSSLPDTVWEELQAQHPDCLIRHTGKQPYGYGWRYVDNGYTFTEIYKKVREVFDYDAIDEMLRQQAAENKPTEPETTEPTQPEVTEPEVTEPEVTEPEVTEPTQPSEATGS